MTRLEFLRGNLAQLQEQEANVIEKTDKKVDKLLTKRDNAVSDLREKQLEEVTAINDHLETLPHVIKNKAKGWKFEVIGLTNAKRVVNEMGTDKYELEEK